MQTLHLLTHLPTAVFWRGLAASALAAVTVALPALATAAHAALPAPAAGSAAADADEQPAAAPAGYAVVIGGALSPENEEVWSQLVALSGGKGARWVVFGTASQSPDRTARRLMAALEKHGAVAEAIPVAPALGWVDLDKAVRDPLLLEQVRSAKGIFFSGGAQERIVDTLQPKGKATPMLDAIWEVYRKGGVVAGTSAGAAIMSTVMFRDAFSIIDVMKGTLREGKEYDHGLGFVGPGLFVDQHFLKRGRFGRMIPLMLAKGYQLGLGIEEDSAAIVHGQQVEIIGTKGALLVDLSAVQTNPKAGAFNLTGARLSYLDRGDRYDLGARLVTPSSRKQRGVELDPTAKSYRPEYEHQPFYVDMLGDTTVVNAMSYLIDSKLTEVRGLAFDPLSKAGAPLADLGFALRLYKGKGSIGWYSDELGGDDYTVSNIYLDIEPVRMSRPLFKPWRN